LLSNDQSLAVEASVNDVKATLLSTVTSNAVKPVKSIVVIAGAVLTVTSPPLPVTVREFNLVWVEPKERFWSSFLFSSPKSAVAPEDNDGSLSLMNVTLTVSKSVAAATVAHQIQYLILQCYYL